MSHFFVILGAAFWLFVIVSILLWIKADSHRSSKDDPF